MTGQRLRGGLVRLFAPPLLAFVVLAFLLSAVWVVSDLRERVVAGRVDELGRLARIMAATLASAPATDSTADALGRQSGLRVSLIGVDGRLIGDSGLGARELASAENHANRPEVIQALARGSGWAERSSATVRQHLLYVAVAVRGTSPARVVRVSSSLEPALAVVRRVRSILMACTGLAALLAVLLARWFAERVGGRIAASGATVDAIGEGRLEERLHPVGRGPFDELDRSVDMMADRIMEQVLDARRDSVDVTALFQGLAEAVAFIDRDGLVRLANPALERWVGRPIEIGSRVTSLFRRPAVLEAIDLAHQGETVTREIEFRDSSLLLATRPHRGGVLLTLRDLTEVRRLEGVRRDFVANVSHELKTPLTSVIGFAEALAGGSLPAERASEFGGRILANATRMRLLVDDLLDLALVESGSWKPESAPVSLAALAKDVWSTLAPSSGQNVTELLVTTEGDDSVLADPEAIRQVFRNLLDNALRHASQSARLEVRISPDGPMIRTEVVDRGPGIPGAHLDRVFERFYRSDPARSRERGGTGLGLAIVKHLVAAHGGEVGIRSFLGRGTVVWFALPSATPHSVPSNG